MPRVFIFRFVLLPQLPFHVLCVLETILSHPIQVPRSVCSDTSSNDPIPFLMVGRVGCFQFCLSLQAMLWRTSLYLFFATFLQVYLKGQLPRVQPVGQKVCIFLFWQIFAPRTRPIYISTSRPEGMTPLPSLLPTLGVIACDNLRQSDMSAWFWLGFISLWQTLTIFLWVCWPCLSIFLLLALLNNVWFHFQK